MCPQTLFTSVWWGYASMNNWQVFEPMSRWRRIRSTEIRQVGSRVSASGRVLKSISKLRAKLYKSPYDEKRKEREGIKKVANKLRNKRKKEKSLRISFSSPLSTLFLLVLFLTSTQGSSLELLQQTFPQPSTDNYKAHWMDVYF